MTGEKRLESWLESWKEIGAYLNKDLRTARPWEKDEGLPVHRQSRRRRASCPSEIGAWRASRKEMAKPAPRALWKIPAFALTLALCLVMLGNGLRPQSASAQASDYADGRLLLRDPGDGSEPHACQGVLGTAAGVRRRRPFVA